MLIKKPFLTLVVMLLVISVIFYIESQKPDLSKSIPKTDSENKKNSKYPNIVGIHTQEFEFEKKYRL